MSTLIFILAAVLVFGSIIFVHELGHFIVAKKSGILVNEFALGMGPTLFKIKRGETTYALRLLPIGGFVSMEGEDEESVHERSFQRAGLKKRMAVIVAGAIMNFVLGFVVWVILTATGGPITSHTVSVVDNPALGLQAGDVITHVNGRRVFIMNDLGYEVLRTQNGTMSMTVKRDGQRVVLENVTFETATETDENGIEYTYISGYGFRVEPQRLTAVSVTREAFNSVLSDARYILLSFSDLIMGRVPVNQLSGPIGIISEVGKAALISWTLLLRYLALISINLGVLNLLPFPALDGGKAVLLIIEGIRKKPLNQKYEIALNLAGFVLLMGLMVFVSFNDIQRLLF